MSGPIPDLFQRYFDPATNLQLLEWLFEILTFLIESKVRYFLNIEALDCTRGETRFDNDVENPDSLIEEIDGLYVNSDGTFFETERTAHYVRDGFNVELEPGRGNINYIDMRVTSNGESQFIEQKSISESASSRKITDRLSGVNGKFDQTKFNKKEVDLSDGPHIVELRLNRGVSRNEQNPFQTVRSGVEQYFADLDSDDPIRIDEVRIFLRKDDSSYRVYRAVIDSEGIHWK